MVEYKLMNGHVLTDEEIEEAAKEWEEGTWEGPLIEIEVHPGRPRLSNEPNANLSFKCPRSAAALIAAAAQMTGVAKSAFIRDAAIEKAQQVLVDSCTEAELSLPGRHSA